MVNDKLNIVIIDDEKIKSLKSLKSKKYCKYCRKYPKCRMYQVQCEDYRTSAYNEFFCKYYESIFEEEKIETIVEAFEILNEEIK